MVFIRKVTRGSKKKFDYSINLPKEIVESMGLVGSTIKFSIRNDNLIISKIVDDFTESLKGETDNSNKENLDAAADYTIH